MFNWPQTILIVVLGVANFYQGVRIGERDERIEILMCVIEDSGSEPSANKLEACTKQVSK